MNRKCKKKDKGIYNKLKTAMEKLELWVIFYFLPFNISVFKTILIVR